MRWTSLCLTAALGCAAPAAPTESPASEPGIEGVLASVRAAVGRAGWSGLRGISFAGDARHSGVESGFRLLLSPDGAFLSEVDGPLGILKGFDGETAWAREPSGVTRVLALEELDRERLLHWFLTGYWLEDEAPVEVELLEGEGDDERIVLRVALADGPLDVRLAIDRASRLPVEARVADEAGERRWEFGDFRSIAGIRLPHRFVRRETGGLADVFEVVEAGEAPVFVRDPYAYLPGRAKDTAFDAGVAAQLEVQRAPTGHLLVHPLLDGEDVGWFILDTGAGALVVDPGTADRLGMSALGEVLAVGAAGAVTTRYRRGDSFQLGPLRIGDPLYVELDLAFLSPFMEAEIAGVCGYDVFARSVVEIEAENATVALHDPAAYELEGGEWVELVLDERLPTVRCAFEGDRSGLFKLDTGASGTLIFHAPAVDRLGLLEGREVRPTQTGGVGGAGEALLGTLAWFELAGHRFERPEVAFARTEVGALADRYTLGNIGGEFLRPFRLVLDYPGRRMALIPAR